jgi:hypothetical protein
MTDPGQLCVPSAGLALISLYTRKTLRIARRFLSMPIITKLRGRITEVGAFYWTALAPEIVNSGREEQGLVSV